MKSLAIRTSQREEFVDITDQVLNEISGNAEDAGIVTVYSPHTTAGVTINEGHDPAVQKDIINYLNSLVPDGRKFTHAEGNSDAHIKVSLVGSSVSVPVENGRLALGTWQRIFFCEFDGPRNRRVIVQLI